MQQKIKKFFNKGLVLNLITILFLLALPYYLFEGKLYIGGDDTRLFYSYPIEFLKNVSFFSWYKLSSLGINGPSQYIVPFLSFWSIISFIISDKIVLNYLALSIPLILGFIFFQKTLKELFKLNDKTNTELLLGSLFYVLSPILIINQMFVFLISIWLIGLIPIVLYYFLKYLRTSNFFYVLIASVWCFILAFAIYAIPWLFGFILPIVVGLIITSIFFQKKELLYFIKHALSFFGFILVSQSFWLTGFISTYLNLGQDSFASKFLSKGFVDTFTPTILSTATGNIFYPLLNLFHRQIPFDFGWKLKDIFINFYDITFVLNLLFVLILFFGILNYKKYLGNTNRKIFLFLLVSFTFSLYFFTVNIGPLKELFILFGNIPGFTMFRNFYDKFAPGYVFLYSVLITISLVIIRKKFKNLSKWINFAILFVIILNFSTVKPTVNSPLWTTDNIYKTINIPSEYLNFMNKIKENISPTNNILSIPFGSSAYTVIKEDNSTNVYAGVSPVKIFSGVNDISGHLSFNFTKVADVIDSLIVEKKYDEFNKIIFEHNVNYVLLTKNIPNQLRTSYLFNPDLFSVQDKRFINNITSRKISTSLFGNYELYQTKQKNKLINSKNSYFQKISEVKYKIYIKNLKDSQSLSFLDSYHAGWSLYIQEKPSLDFCVSKDEDVNSTECKVDSKLFQPSELTYLFTKPVFKDTQSIIYDFANQWIIDPNYIKNNFDKGYYKQNKDGTIDIELVLYFKPQLYFYIGTLISLITFVFGLIYFIKKKNEKNK